MKEKKLRKRYKKEEERHDKKYRKENTLHEKRHDKQLNEALEIGKEKPCKEKKNRK